MGGKAISKVYSEGSNGNWDVNAVAKQFNRQAVTALLGLIFVFLSLTTGKIRPTGSELPPDLLGLPARIGVLEEELRDLRSEMDGFQQSQSAPSVSTPGEAEKGTKSGELRQPTK